MVVRDLFRYCFLNRKPGPGQSDKNNERKRGISVTKSQTILVCREERCQNGLAEKRSKLIS